MINEQESPADGEQVPEGYRRLGELTRTLHDSLRQLGYDKNLEAAVSSMPDARTRLAYISRLTGNAAEKVLNLVDRAAQDQTRLARSAVDIEAELKANPASAVASGRVLEFIQDVHATTESTGAHLTEIMMAQDFHDLTGQVIGKVVALAQEVEVQLLKLLIEAAGERQHLDRPKVDAGWLNGPAMHAAHRSDVVQNQQQVDDLLESLGF